MAHLCSLFMQLSVFVYYRLPIVVIVKLFLSLLDIYRAFEGAGEFKKSECCWKPDCKVSEIPFTTGHLFPSASEPSILLWKASCNSFLLFLPGICMTFLEMKTFYQRKYRYGLYQIQCKVIKGIYYYHVMKLMKASTSALSLVT